MTASGVTNVMSPEVLNNMIKRPLKQEDLKPPPLPKAKRQQSKAVAPSPKEDKTPRTPAATAATPAAAESSTPASTSAPGPKKRKASAATPKLSKKAKGDAKVDASPAVATPLPLAATPAAADTPASTSAAGGYASSAPSVSRSTHADYFAQQAKAAESERGPASSFFTVRQNTAGFDGDIAAALSMWSDAQGDAAPLVVPQTEDALADQSWHDFINEQSFDGDEPTPLLTRCRSLDTDPDCSPRDADVLGIGRSPLAQMHTAYATAAEKRRLPLMSPSAQMYNGMLYVDAEEEFP